MKSSDAESHHLEHHVLSISKCPCQTERGDELHQRIEDFFSLENFGTRVLTNIVESEDIQIAKRIMEETIVRRDKRFEIGLLWKYDNAQMPNNFKMVMKGPECQHRRI